MFTHSSMFSKRPWKYCFSGCFSNTLLANSSPYIMSLPLLFRMHSLPNTSSSLEPGICKRKQNTTYIFRGAQIFSFLPWGGLCPPSTLGLQPCQYSYLSLLYNKLKELATELAASRSSAESFLKFLILCLWSWVFHQIICYRPIYYFCVKI